jgi:predicted nucleic acid-binding protein
MVSACDSNLFLDVLDGTAEEQLIARMALDRAADHGKVIISAICYAELAPRFGSAAKLDAFLQLFRVTLSHIDARSAFLAGQYYKAYRSRGGTRARILADFLIAAHARLNADRIMTRDDRFFGDRFPGLAAIAPKDVV